MKNIHFYSLILIIFIGCGKTYENTVFCDTNWEYAITKIVEINPPYRDTTSNYRVRNITYNCDRTFQTNSDKGKWKYSKKDSILSITYTEGKAKSDMEYLGGQENFNLDYKIVIQTDDSLILKHSDKINFFYYTIFTKK